MMQDMSTRPGPRTPVSIAMNRRERILAEAIGRLFGSASAGVGVRESLRIMEDRLKANGQAEELRRLMTEVDTELKRAGR